MSEAAIAYVRAGLALVPIPTGLKGPKGSAALDWNVRENCVTTKEQAARLNGCNFGLAHLYCSPTPTAAIDIDDLSLATPWLAERGIDLRGLLNANDSVQVSSGRE